jgi:hypothetical protein
MPISEGYARLNAEQYSLRLNLAHIPCRMQARASEDQIIEQRERAEIRLLRPEFDGFYNQRSS